jgi:hypothetical protein
MPAELRAGFRDSQDRYAAYPVAKAACEHVGIEVMSNRSDSGLEGVVEMAARSACTFESSSVLHAKAAWKTI